MAAATYGSVRSSARPQGPSGQSARAERPGSMCGAGGGAACGGAGAANGGQPMACGGGAARGANGARRTMASSGVATGPAAAAQPSINMLRIPSELQAAMNGSNGVPAADARGIVSPLPFESSLAPDFLALFANSSFDHDQ